MRNALAGEVSEDADEPEAILKCLCADVHLIGAEIDAEREFHACRGSDRDRLCNE